MKTNRRRFFKSTTAAAAGMIIRQFILPSCSKDRCNIRGTWFINDYSIGWLAGWGAHPLDIAVMGAKGVLGGVYTLKGEGKFWPQEGLFDSVISWDTHLEYNNGLKMHFLSSDRARQIVEKYRDYDATDGTTFFGEKGWISLSRWTARASDPQINKILNDFPKDSKGRIKSEDYMHGANFAQVIKGKMSQFDPLDEAIMSDCISHMADISIRAGKEVNWDPVKGAITNQPDAIKLFDREMKAPYNNLS